MFVLRCSHGAAVEAGCLVCSKPSRLSRRTGMSMKLGQSLYLTLTHKVPFGVCSSVLLVHVGGTYVRHVPASDDVLVQTCWTRAEAMLRLNCLLADNVIARSGPLPFLCGVPGQECTIGRMASPLTRLLSGTKVTMSAQAWKTRFPVKAFLKDTWPWCGCQSPKSSDLR
ncbi:uncharacterized protein BO95DRAFT_1456 [Aspergillus brunneoviolaceus CBS 621.78]|uniref:Uncharacterized protein n=1 Tax=Aspergillus brunneoviolaceus CBS 621.78 TaxID=1450534 RepID=A0ACD1GPT1_9EURO|nr:hypothetical protein BO95DRAFT_1456 [Aspergillus brunneoviolaceus CBS 621.78]RAH51374.1 hypothetical protein BO95DRAFT_1456 [Aspergillus brunneoviolaceus CBS 621.78]